MRITVLFPFLISALLVLDSGSAYALENPSAADAEVANDAGGDGWDESSDDDFIAELEDEFNEEFDAEAKSADKDIPDPLEPFNRAMFAFNDKLYFHVLKPIARGYRVVPVPVRRSVARFFTNLQGPVRIVNNALQLKMKNTGTELLRLGINTTIGVGGLFDPARRYWGLRRKDEDFGQTLGHYGVGPGFYLVLPFYGSYTLRDGLSAMVDTLYLDPIYRYIDELWIRLAVRGFSMVNTLSLDKDTYEALKRDALDPYAFVKHAYAQHRAGQIKE